MAENILKQLNAAFKNEKIASVATEMSGNQLRVYFLGEGDGGNIYDVVRVVHAVVNEPNLVTELYRTSYIDESDESVFIMRADGWIAFGGLDDDLIREREKTVEDIDQELEIAVTKLAMVVNSLPAWARRLGAIIVKLQSVNIWKRKKR